MEKQNKYTETILTNYLIELGLQPESKEGFQFHELINLIPNPIRIKKTFLTDLKKVTDFKLTVTYDIWDQFWTLSLQKANGENKYDQGLSRDQLVDALAAMVCYLQRYNLISIKQEDKGHGRIEK